jgi:hypothetical protein
LLIARLVWFGLSVLFADVMFLFDFLVNVPPQASHWGSCFIAMQISHKEEWKRLNILRLACNHLMGLLTKSIGSGLTDNTFVEYFALMSPRLIFYKPVSLHQGPERTTWPCLSTTQFCH